MKIDVKFWLPLTIYSAFMLFVIWFLLTPGQPKPIMAEDGTQCLYYKLSLSCNHEQRNFDTQFGVYPLAINLEESSRMVANETKKGH